MENLLAQLSESQACVEMVRLRTRAHCHGELVPSRPCHPPSAQLRREALAAVLGQCDQNLQLDLVRTELAKVLLVALLEGCLEGRQVGVGVPSDVASFAGVLLR